MKKIIIGIMVGLIISCTVGVLAASIVPSTIVTYQNKTLNTALDELYDSVNLLKTKGNAEANQILTGKKAIVKGTEITGTMANRGKLNWNPSSSTTYTVPAGYYSGGTISSSNAYSKGVTDADNRANASSVNYKTGYNAGYSSGMTTTKNNMSISTLSVYSAWDGSGANKYSIYGNGNVFQFTLNDSTKSLFTIKFKKNCTVYSTGVPNTTYFSVSGVTSLKNAGVYKVSAGQTFSLSGSSSYGTMGITAISF